MKRLLPLFVLLFLLSSFSISSAEILVTNAQEFVQAIGPQRTIVLQPGDYDLSSVSDMSSQYYHFIDAYDGMELEIKGVSNLTIRGLGKMEAHLIARPQYGHVLRFRGCQGIIIDNIKAGHGPEKGYCMGGVLHFEGCRGIRINNCHLYGSGTEGLTFRQTQGVSVFKTIIKGCTYGILSAFQSQGITFSKCWFFDNEEFDLVNLSKSAQITFKKCKFRNNRASEYSLFFNCHESVAISLARCTFEKNTTGYFANSKSTLKIKGAKFIDNTFENSKFKEASE